MVLYVDETENDRFFIVTGFLVNDQELVRESYKRFKNRVSNLKLTQKTKQRIFKEFKSSSIDHGFQKIKRELLKSIVETTGSCLFSTHIKKSARLNQKLKEATYITLLSSIVGAIDASVEIIFDSFGKPDFENNIIHAIGSSFEHVASITPGKSELYPGLQFADNVCSVVRLHLSDEDRYSYYDIIINILTEV
ncbi:MAG: DUF3800 domain-containing protein [Firmicutes bacterium]|nr:DUF3800 domain-containing protein [Bacillota bacterium]